MFGIVLLVHCGFTRASVKTASMSKQRKLPTYWFVPVGNKRDNWFQSQCSCGYFKVWSTYKAVVEMNIPRILTSVEYSVSVCTPDYSCISVPLIVTQLPLDKGRNGSHSIICKVTCCLLSLFLLHSFYLYLNVLGNLRTNVQVKMQ